MSAEPAGWHDSQGNLKFLASYSCSLPQKEAREHTGMSTFKYVCVFKGVTFLLSYVAFLLVMCYFYVWEYIELLMWEVCMCGWETGVRSQSLRNSILRTFLAMSYPTPTFWQHLSLVWSSLINLDCQASEPQGSPCLCLPETGITSMSHHSQPFYVGSEYQIHFTWLVWQAFLPTEPSLQTYGCVGGGGRWAVRACTSTV